MSELKTIADIIYFLIKTKGEGISYKELYEGVRKYRPNTTDETCRCAVYRDRSHNFNIKEAGGCRKEIYIVENSEDKISGVVIEGDSRNMQGVIPNNSMDLVLSDHPWKDEKNHTAGNQKSFVEGYKDSCFLYKLDDFVEKARVLKQGRFLVEILPEESAGNSEYLTDIKKMARQAGLHFYAKVPWVKEGVSQNTGRKEKYGCDIYFFTKGEPFRFSPKGKPYFTSTILPKFYLIPPVKPCDKLHQAEKPVALYERILEAVSLPNEVVLEMHGGSGSSAEACINKGRFPVVIEYIKETAEKIAKRIGAVKLNISESFKEIKNTSSEVKEKNAPTKELNSGQLSFAI